LRLVNASPYDHVIPDGEDGLTSGDPLDGVIIPLEATDIVSDAHTSFELALEKVAFIQE